MDKLRTLEGERHVQIYQKIEQQIEKKVETEIELKVEQKEAQVDRKLDTIVLKANVSPDIQIKVKTWKSRKNQFLANAAENRHLLKKSFQKS